MTTETRPTTVPEVLPRERTVSDVLLAAARYIEEHGWWDGRLGTTAGHCPVTAILAVTTDLEERVAARSRLCDFLGLPVDGTATTTPIASWNDTPGRTEAEVIAALRAAAGSEA